MNKYRFLNLHTIAMQDQDKILLFPIGICESGKYKIKRRKKILISSENLTVKKFTASHEHQTFTKAQPLGPILSQIHYTSSQPVVLKSILILSNPNFNV
jgi:hypothetical protein